MEAWLICLLIVFCVIILFFCCACLTKYFSNFGSAENIERVVCYLCLEVVTKDQWQDGSHRRQCARRHRQFLQSMAKIDTKCWICSKRLLQWPLIGSSFYCDGRNCLLFGTSIVNSGNNRFNCYMCDFDLCINCIDNNASTLRSDWPRPITEESSSLTVILPSEEPVHDNDLPTYEEALHM